MSKALGIVVGIEVFMGVVPIVTINYGWFMLFVDRAAYLFCPLFVDVFDFIEFLEVLDTIDLFEFLSMLWVDLASSMKILFFSFLLIES
jgi:hypothetical protein